MSNRVSLHEAVTVRSVNGPLMTIIQGASAPEGMNGDGAIRSAYVGNRCVLSGFTLDQSRPAFAGFARGGRSSRDASPSAGRRWIR